jgi:hypothetical protein
MACLNLNGGRALARRRQLGFWCRCRCRGCLLQTTSRGSLSRSCFSTALLRRRAVKVRTHQNRKYLPFRHPFANELSGQLAELHVHALPLSSQLLSPHVPLPLPLPPSDALSAQFLAPLHHTLAAPKSPVRKRDLFEEAAAARKKARSKGGEGVAAAAARGSESQHGYNRRKSSIDAKGAPFSDSRPSSAQGLSRPSSRQLSRSPSVSSDIRPLTRKDTLDGQNKRSNLSRVATISLQPEEPTTESRNKEALSRVVMAAMRMHGLQQRKKTKSRNASTVSGLGENQSIGDDAVAAAEDAAKDDEYKLIYHQTYKGAALALVRTTVLSTVPHTHHAPEKSHRRKATACTIRQAPRSRRKAPCRLPHRSSRRSCPLARARAPRSHAWRQTATRCLWLDAWSRESFRSAEWISAPDYALQN